MTPVGITINQASCQYVSGTWQLNVVDTAGFRQVSLNGAISQALALLLQAIQYTTPPSSGLPGDGSTDAQSQGAGTDVGTCDCEYANGTWVVVVGNSAGTRTIAQSTQVQGALANVLAVTQASTDPTGGISGDGSAQADTPTS